MSAYYVWDNTTNDWVGSGTKYEYSYDAAGNLTMYAG